MICNTKQNYSTNLIALFTLLFWASFAFCAETKIFRDKEGFFIATPPLGWGEKNYPSENVWQKISFHHPTNKNVYIFIACGPTPSKDYTLENLWDENQHKIKQFRNQYPTGKFDYKKDIIAEMDVHVFDMDIPSILKQKIITSIIGNTIYSLTFKAKDKKEFSKYDVLFKEFYNSFIPLKTEENYSEEDIKNAMVARYKVLAELSIKLDQIESALFYINKGLSIDQNNKKLLKIKSSIK